MSRKGRKTGNLAKANGGKSKQGIPRQHTLSTKPSPKPENLLQTLERWWKAINPWWKRCAAAASVLAAVYAAWPHFSIARETVVAQNPFTANFRFTNDGWLPAMNVVIKCWFGKEGTGGIMRNGAEFRTSNLTIAIPVADWVKGHTPITRSCGLSAAGAKPRGGIHVGIDYQGPFVWFKQHDETYFSFRYDSSAGGYVFVPDFPPP